MYNLQSCLVVGNSKLVSLSNPNLLSLSTHLTRVPLKSSGIQYGEQIDNITWIVIDVRIGHPYRK